MSNRCIRTVQGNLLLDISVSFDDNQSTKEEELKPGGSGIDVTLENRQEFVNLYTEWIFYKHIEKQFEAFKRGFTRICNSPLLKSVTGEQLARIVMGEQDVELVHLREKAIYDGFVSTSKYISGFWEILQSFDLEQSRQFLSFVTGNDRAPLGGLGELTLRIHRNGGDTDRLPTAHTCFNLLLLPEYASLEKLSDLLIIAVNNADGFGLE